MKSFATRIYLFALVLRLIPTLLSYDLPIGLDDMFQYDMLARSLAAGDGYRWYAEDDLHLIQQYIDLDFKGEGYDPRGIVTSFRPPAYPAFLAVIYKIFGFEHRLFAARILQAFLSALLAPLTYLLTKRVFPTSAKAAKWSAVAVSVYPMLVVYPLALATENLLMPLLLGILLMLLKAGETHQTKDYIFVGLLLGFSSLTRSAVSVIVPVAMLWAWYYAKDKKALYLIPLFTFLVTVPWAVRNTLLHDKPTYIESTLGYNLYMGYHPDAEGTFQYGVSVDLLPYMDDSERDQVGIQAALEFIKDDPARVPELVLKKLGYFFGIEKRAFSYFYSNNVLGFIPLPILVLVTTVFWLPFVVIGLLAAIGFSFYGWTSNASLVTASVLAYFLPLIFILTDPRMHLPIIPYLAITAAYAWEKRKDIIAKTRLASHKTQTIIALTIVGLLVFNWGYEINRDMDKLVALFGPEGNFARFDY